MSRSKARKERDALRTARRDSLLILLSRAQRGVLSRPEAEQLRVHVEAELALADQTRASAGGQQVAQQRTAHQLEAAHDAIREAEQRAADAEEQLTAYRAVFGPNALDDFHAMQHRAKTAEADAERYKADHARACEQIAAMHAAAVGETRGPLLGIVEDVASVRAAFEAQHARADTLDRLCREQRARADKAEAALAHVRDAQTLGDALAAVARHDGLTTEAAAAHAAFTDAADSTRARLEEQARAHAIELATVRRAIHAAERALTTIRHARTWGEAWAALGMYYGLRPEECGQQARARRTADERAADDRAAGWRRHALEADERADRHLAAWRSARRRARRTETELERIRGWLAHWADRARAAEPRLDRLALAWRSARRRAQERTRDAYANGAEYRTLRAEYDQRLAAVADQQIAYAGPDLPY